MVQKVKLTPGKNHSPKADVEQYIPDTPDADAIKEETTPVSKVIGSVPEQKKQLTLVLDDTQLLADFACAALTGMTMAYPKASNADKIASDAFVFAEAMLVNHKKYR